VSNDVVVASDGEVKAGNDNVDASRECVMRFSYFGGMDDLPDGEVEVNGEENSGNTVPMLVGPRLLMCFCITSLFAKILR